MIQDTLSKVVYTADGLQRQWYIPFQFNDKEDLHIYLTNDGIRVEEIVQNFEIIENGEIKKIDNPDVEVIPAGNYVIYPTEESGIAPLEAGKQILILRETPNTQLEDSSQIYFKSNDVERALDKLTMQVQELTRDSYRAVKVSHFDTTTPEDFTEALFEAGAKAEEAAARAATSESNAALSEQNAASSASSASYSSSTAATASANALAAADLARSRANDSLRNAERAEIAAADSNMHASNSAASANTAATLLQQVSNSIYNKAQVDEKISGLQAEIDTVEASIPSVREDLNQGLSELQTQISNQSSAIAGKQDKLIAGSNITINGNVISATGGGGGGGNAGSADIAKAIENQNKASDTIDPIYNWLGTQQEYEEQNIALEHPDWVCFITDDMGEQGGGTGGSSEAKWGAITGDINAQTDLITAIAEKQDKLTAGEGITIDGNVISATGVGGGGSAELPDNVYTEDNLVAGDNIQIKDVVNPNVIDDNTLLCWHFDGDTKDVVQGAEIELYPGYASLNTSVYKFGSASCPDYLNPGKYISLGTTITDNDNFTIDFWTKALKDHDTFSWQCSLMGTTSINFSAFGSNNLLFQAIDPYYGTEVASIQKTNTIDASNWSHWAFTYNKDTREVAVYANGAKQGSVVLPTSFTFSFDTFSPLATNYNQGLIDELRVTKSLAWEKNFTPPTEAYTKGEGVAKKAISAVIPPVKLPSDLYRQSNLLGGRNIEIVPEPVEGGIDEYTLACWHFDEDLVDEKNNLTLVGSGFEITAEASKFGNCSAKMNSSGDYATVVSDVFADLFTKDFTIDFWLRREEFYVGNTLFGFSDKENAYDVRSFPFNFALGSAGSSTSSDIFRINDTKIGSVGFSDVKVFGHIAIVFSRENRTCSLYLNGSKLGEYVFSTLPTNTKNLSFYFPGSGTTMRFDEFRVSDCIRWTEDFTPPMLPYRKAEPTGNYVVNYVKPVGEVESLKTDFSNYGGFPHTIDPQKIDGVLYLQTNKIYRLGLEGHTILSLPTMPDETTSSNQILIKAYVHPGASLEWGTYVFYNKSVPILQEETYYDLVFDYDQGQLAWVAAAIPSGRTDI